jgi:branched-chain amino acid transport system ATP-binding protein
MALLEVRGVQVRFGGVMAVDGVDLDVEPGRITGLIGPNGAGKTTLFNVVTGVQESTAGRVVIDGLDITDEPAFRRARHGLARTFQRLELFTSLSVADNVRVAVELTAERNVDGRVDELLRRVGATDQADQRAGDLPTGAARMVEVARALATSPRVLLLDEPASGLDDQETERFGALLSSLAGDGLAVLIVEHDMSLVMKVCHDIYVLDLGRVIAHGPPAEVQRDRAVLEAYLGVA